MVPNKLASKARRKDAIVSASKNVEMCHTGVIYQGIQRAMAIDRGLHTATRRLVSGYFQPPDTEETPDSGARHANASNLPYSRNVAITGDPPRPARCRTNSRSPAPVCQR
jgi:hypothetical protein